MLRGFDCDTLRKYPDPDVQELREALAKRHGLDCGQVFVGVGSAGRRIGVCKYNSAVFFHIIFFSDLKIFI